MIVELLYVNGYDKFKVIARQNAREQVFDFSFKYEALTEYYIRKTTLDEYTDGSKSKISHYLNYWWEVDYGNYIERSDRLKWGAIENLEIEGWQIILIPHIDTEALRYFNILFNDDIERELGLHSHFNTGENTPNKGFKIGMLNQDPILRVNLLDPPLPTDPLPVSGGTEGNPNKGGVQL